MEGQGAAVHTGNPSAVQGIQGIPSAQWLDSLAKIGEFQVQCLKK